MTVSAIVLLVVGVVGAGCATTTMPSPSGAAAPTTSVPAHAMITFGSAVHPTTSFSLDDEVRWTVTLPEPVDGTKVNVVITEPNNDLQLFGYVQFVTDPDRITLTNEMPLGRFLPDPGVYVMRYISLDGEVLAQGQFTLVADSR